MARYRIRSCSRTAYQCQKDRVQKFLRKTGDIVFDDCSDLVHYVLKLIADVRVSGNYRELVKIVAEIHEQARFLKIVQKPYQIQVVEVLKEISDTIKCLLRIAQRTSFTAIGWLIFRGTRPIEQIYVDGSQTPT